MSLVTANCVLPRTAGALCAWTPGTAPAWSDGEASAPALAPIGDDIEAAALAAKGGGSGPRGVDGAAAEEDDND